VFRRAEDGGVKAGIGLSAGVTLAALLLAGGIVLWIGEVNDRLRETYISERRADLGVALHAEKARLTQSVEGLRQDTAFLALTPPVAGMVRASTNKGIDPRDRDTYAAWETRLQETFAAFLRLHPDYLQMSFIDAAGEGRELVRVDNRGGRIDVTPHEALQPRGGEDYFKAGLMLTAGRVHLSRFSLFREEGKSAEPGRPALLAVTPVFDANGRVFGMVAISKDVGALLSSPSAGLPPGMLGYVADQEGRYLSHPDAVRAFTSGDQGSIARDFPSLEPMFDTGAQSYLPLRGMVGRDGEAYLAAERIFFDASDPARFLVLVYHIPAAVAARQAAHFPRLPVAAALLLMFVAGGFASLMLRRAFFRTGQQE
jgi:hypothetical protein